MILNNLEIGRIVKFDYRNSLCYYKVITMECDKIIEFNIIEKIHCSFILLIDKEIENIFPDHKINEHRYGVGNHYYNTVDFIKDNDEIKHILAHTKILDFFIQVKWLYTLILLC